MSFSLQTAHPWHGLDTRTDHATICDVVIEIPKRARTKYEIDKNSGLIRLDRVLFGSMVYPANYGIFPRTLATDHDPLDVLVLTEQSLVPLSLVRVRIVGVMRMIDQSEVDDKILAVPVADPQMSHVYQVTDLPPHTFIEIKNFFEQYTKLENKIVEIPQFEDREVALKVLDAAIELYNRHFRHK
jgi:inorganic pyrophosphatase